MVTAVVKKYGKSIRVEVLDVCQNGDGRLVSVRALEGKPFVGGDKWPIWTPYALVDAKDITLEDIPDDLPIEYLLSDCTCFLPEQSCPDCRAAARKVYAPYDEIPF